MKKADLIIIAVAAVVVGVLIFFLYGLNSDSGSYVQIEVDGKVTQVLPLDTDTEYEIETVNDGANTIEIKEGKAKMIYANCPDGICTNHKEINRNGESIICLPHKVVVTIVNDYSSGDDIDAVA